jgi:hypothetical protein
MLVNNIEVGKCFAYLAYLHDISSDALPDLQKATQMLINSLMPLFECSSTVWGGMT